MNVSLDFVNLDKIGIISSETKYYLGKSVQGLIASLVIKTIRRSKNTNKARFSITEVSLKDISKIIK